MSIVQSAGEVKKRTIPKRPGSGLSKNKSDPDLGTVEIELRSKVHSSAQFAFACAFFCVILLSYEARLWILTYLLLLFCHILVLRVSVLIIIMPLNANKTLDSYKKLQDAIDLYECNFGNGVQQL